MLRMMKRIVVGVVSFKPEDGAVFHIGFESTFAATNAPSTLLASTPVQLLPTLLSLPFGRCFRSTLGL